ncbi:TetR/AcrR family transcriptional regulator [Bombilactobacillus bombi]|uniref:TetR/AcrR family transcriptional regulator n=1 Tax=Bombilactobacillus bombi TaxID=1303590 RepID=A0A3R6YTP1_9LACO|nr:TetR/AcrR family transcriptional regulator [Bombilactobacillus bombi]RHW51826.1 TetR/AcrR family transcriptional regulator [Bombilactobacillus bombi]
MSDVDSKILAAFSQLVVQYGYQGTTTKKIAQAAQVNESTLFRHFKDKRGILQALVQNYMTDIQTVGQNYQLIGDLEQDLMNFAIIYQNFVDQHLALFLTAIRESGNIPELAQPIKMLLELVREILTKKLLKMQQTGEISTNINIELEINNLILLNLGQAIMQHSFPKSVFQLSRTTFVESNIRVYAQHLKPLKD